MDNKEKTKAFFKALFLAIWGISSITTSVAVWNATKGAIPDGFYCVMAVISVVLSILAIAKTAKKYFK